MSPRKKKEYVKKFLSLELNSKEIIDEVASHSHKEMPHEENLFIPLTTDEQVQNRVDMSFENANLYFDLRVTLDFLQSVGKRLGAHFEQFPKKIDIRMIIENGNKKEAIKALEPLIIKNRNFEVKLTHSGESITYYIIDQKELWIRLQKTTESGRPCVLWTNDKSMVNFFQENFNQTWNNHKAIKIYPSPTAVAKKS